MASGPDHMRASASSEPLVDREWQATTAVAAVTSALDEPHAVAQPAEHVVVRRDSSREEREGMSGASVGTVLSAPSLAGKPIAMSVDVETHGWLTEYQTQRDRCTDTTGEFGHICWVNSELLDFGRVVQVGWCFIDAHGEIVERQELCVSNTVSCLPNAIDYHGLTDEHLKQHGRPLSQVLDRLQHALELLERHGGTLVAHHLEFDAGFLVREFRRLGHLQGAALLTRLAKAGTCTMNQMRDIQLPLKREKPSLDWCCCVIVVPTPKSGARHNAL